MVYAREFGRGLWLHTGSAEGCICNDDSFSSTIGGIVAALGTASCLISVVMDVFPVGWLGGNAGKPKAPSTFSGDTLCRLQRSLMTV